MSGGPYISANGNRNGRVSDASAPEDDSFQVQDVFSLMAIPRGPHASISRESSPRANAAIAIATPPPYVSSSLSALPNPHPRPSSASPYVSASMSNIPLREMANSSSSSQLAPSKPQTEEPVETSSAVPIIMAADPVYAHHHASRPSLIALDINHIRFESNHGVVIPRKQHVEKREENKIGIFGIIKNYVIGTDAIKHSRDAHQHADPELLKRIIDKRDRRTSEEAAAEDEHRSLSKESLCAMTPTRMIEMLGSGVSWYFTFSKYLWLVNLILLGIACANIIPHLQQVRDLPEGDRPPFQRMFFLSTYSSSLHSRWFISSIVGIAVMFATGPIYHYYVEWYHRKRQRGDADYIEDPFEGQYSIDTEDCIDKIDYGLNPPTPESQYRRRILSILIFITVLIIQAAINYFFQSFTAQFGDAVIAVVLSFVVKLMNFIWEFFCQYLTKFERHLYWSEFRKWDCIKVFLFKIANVCVLFFVKRLELNIGSSSRCPLDNMASQFALLLLFDFFANFVIDTIGPSCLNVYNTKREERDARANEELRREFRLSAEYVKMLYRQFIVGLGFFVIPILPGLALILGVVEYWLDKYRMMRITQRPKRTNNTFKHVILFFFFLMSACILLTFPNGAIWILSGTLFNLKSNPHCYIFQ